MAVDFAKPAPSPPVNGRIESLREAIRSIERRAPTFDAGGSAATPPWSANPSNTWRLGEPDLDGLTGPGGLDTSAVHEIKPAATADWAAAGAAARHFALALTVRRLITTPPARQDVLVCFSAAQANELGAPYAPGLAALGLDPGRLIVVEPARPSDVLWAIEEGLKSRGLALVLGGLDDVGLTPARRLALAAAQSKTPCLLLTHPRSPGTAATATRWRIAPAPGAHHPLDPEALDPEALGPLRFDVGLERCRGSPAAARSVPLQLEWCDVASGFRLASRMADRSPRTHLPARGAAVAVGWAG